MDSSKISLKEGFDFLFEEDKESKIADKRKKFNIVYKKEDVTPNSIEEHIAYILTTDIVISAVNGEEEPLLFRIYNDPKSLQDISFVQAKTINFGLLAKSVVTRIAFEKLFNVNKDNLKDLTAINLISDQYRASLAALQNAGATRMMLEAKMNVIKISKQRYTMMFRTIKNSSTFLPKTKSQTKIDFTKIFLTVLNRIDSKELLKTKSEGGKFEIDESWKELNNHEKTYLVVYKFFKGLSKDQISPFGGKSNINDFLTNLKSNGDKNASNPISIKELVEQFKVLWYKTKSGKPRAKKRAKYLEKNFDEMIVKALKTESPEEAKAIVQDTSDALDADFFTKLNNPLESIPFNADEIDKIVQSASERIESLDIKDEEAQDNADAIINTVRDIKNRINSNQSEEEIQKPLEDLISLSAEEDQIDNKELSKALDDNPAELIKTVVDNSLDAIEDIDTEKSEEVIKDDKEEEGGELSRPLQSAIVFETALEKPSNHDAFMRHVIVYLAVGRIFNNLSAETKLRESELNTTDSIINALRDMSNNLGTDINTENLIKSINSLSDFKYNAGMIIEEEGQDSDKLKIKIESSNLEQYISKCITECNSSLKTLNNDDNLDVLKLLDDVLFFDALDYSLIELNQEGKTTEKFSTIEEPLNKIQNAESGELSIEKSEKPGSVKILVDKEPVAQADFVSGQIATVNPVIEDSSSNIKETTPEELAYYLESLNFDEDEIKEIRNSANEAQEELRGRLNEAVRDLKINLSEEEAKAIIDAVTNAKKIDLSLPSSGKSDNFNKLFYILTGSKSSEPEKDKSSEEDSKEISKQKEEESYSYNDFERSVQISLLEIYKGLFRDNNKPKIGGKFYDWKWIFENKLNNIDSEQEKEDFLYDVLKRHKQFNINPIRERIKDAVSSDFEELFNGLYSSSEFDEKAFEGAYLQLIVSAVNNEIGSVGKDQRIVDSLNEGFFSGIAQGIKSAAAWVPSLGIGVTLMTVAKGVITALGGAAFIPVIIGLLSAMTIFSACKDIMKFEQEKAAYQKNPVKYIDNIIFKDKNAIELIKELTHRISAKRIFSLYEYKGNPPKKNILAGKGSSNLPILQKIDKQAEMYALYAQGDKDSLSAINQGLLKSFNYSRLYHQDIINNSTINSIFNYLFLNEKIDSHVLTYIGNMFDSDNSKLQDLNQKQKEDALNKFKEILEKIPEAVAQTSFKSNFINWTENEVREHSETVGSKSRFNLDVEYREELKNDEVGEGKFSKYIPKSFRQAVKRNKQLYITPEQISEDLTNHLFAKSFGIFRDDSKILKKESFYYNPDAIIKGKLKNVLFENVNFSTNEFINEMMDSFGTPGDTSSASKRNSSGTKKDKETKEREKELTRYTTTAMLSLQPGITNEFFKGATGGIGAEDFFKAVFNTLKIKEAHGEPTVSDIRKAAKAIEVLSQNEIDKINELIKVYGLPEVKNLNDGKIKDILDNLSKPLLKFAEEKEDSCQQVIDILKKNTFTKDVSKIINKLTPENFFKNISSLPSESFKGEKMSQQNLKELIDWQRAKLPGTNVSEDLSKNPWDVVKKLGVAIQKSAETKLPDSAVATKTAAGLGYVNSPEEAVKYAKLGMDAIHKNILVNENGDDVVYQFFFSNSSKLQGTDRALGGIKVNLTDGTAKMMGKDLYFQKNFASGALKAKGINFVDKLPQVTGGAQELAADDPKSVQTLKLIIKSLSGSSSVKQSETVVNKIMIKSLMGQQSAMMEDLKTPEDLPAFLFKQWSLQRGSPMLDDFNVIDNMQDPKEVVNQALSGLNNLVKNVPDYEAKVGSVITDPKILKASKSLEAAHKLLSSEGLDDSGFVQADDTFKGFNLDFPWDVSDDEDLILPDGHPDMKVAEEALAKYQLAKKEFGEVVAKVIDDTFTTEDRVEIVKVIKMSGPAKSLGYNPTYKAIAQKVAAQTGQTELQIAKSVQDSSAESIVKGQDFKLLKFKSLENGKQMSQEIGDIYQDQANLVVSKMENTGLDTDKTNKIADLVAKKSAAEQKLQILKNVKSSSLKTLEGIKEDVNDAMKQIDQADQDLNSEVQEIGGDAKKVASKIERSLKENENVQGKVNDVVEQNTTEVDSAEMSSTVGQDTTDSDDLSSFDKGSSVIGDFFNDIGDFFQERGFGFKDGVITKDGLSLTKKYLGTDFSDSDAIISKTISAKIGAAGLYSKIVSKLWTRGIRGGKFAKDFVDITKPEDAFSKMIEFALKDINFQNYIQQTSKDVISIVNDFEKGVNPSTLLYKYTTSEPTLSIEKLSKIPNEALSKTTSLNAGFMYNVNLENFLFESRITKKHKPVENIKNKINLVNEEIDNHKALLKEYKDFFNI